MFCNRCLYRLYCVYYLYCLFCFLHAESVSCSFWYADTPFMYVAISGVERQVMVCVATLVCIFLLYAETPCVSACCRPLLPDPEKESGREGAWGSPSSTSASTSCLSRPVLPRQLWQVAGWVGFLLDMICGMESALLEGYYPASALAMGSV